MGKFEKEIIGVLKKTGQPLTLGEIAIEINVSEKKVYKSLKKLFEKGKINCVNRRYSLSEDAT